MAGALDYLQGGAVSGRLKRVVKFLTLRWRNEGVIAAVHDQKRRIARGDERYRAGIAGKIGFILRVAAEEVLDQRDALLVGLGLLYLRP